MAATGYFSHPDCRKHEMGAGHPECAERLDAIEDRLLASGVGDALDRREAPQASLTDVELAHTRLHIASLRGLSIQLIGDQRPCPRVDTRHAFDLGRAITPDEGRVVFGPLRRGPEAVGGVVHVE